MLKAAPLVTRLVEQLRDLRLIGLRLRELVPSRAHQRLGVLAHLIGAAAHRRDVLVEGGALLRIEIELRGDFLVALHQAPSARGRVQPGPYGAGDKAQIQHQRYDQHRDQQARVALPSSRCHRSGGGSTHVRAPGVRSRRKAVEGSSMSRRKPSSLAWSG